MDGIVQQHGGFLRLESSPGKGTLARVFIPRPAESAPSSLPPRSHRYPCLVRGTELFLVAEDEPALRALVETTLTSLGYRVIAVHDGEQAARVFEERAAEIDLVVLDVVMPRLDARAAYERMQRVRPDLRVLFMTGYAPAATRLAALLASRGAPLLEKPFSPMVLATAVRAALDGAPAGEATARAGE